MPKLETDVLAELIGVKRACLLRLREMGRRQLELIDSGDMISLLDFLSVKQQTLLQLQRIERTLDPFRGQDPEARRWQSPQHRQACAEQVQQCETLLAEIISQEKRGEIALVRRRDEVALRLQGAHLAGQARGAYTAQPQHGIGQLDLMSES
jgi:hypothetical protein